MYSYDKPLISNVAIPASAAPAIKIPAVATGDMFKDQSRPLDAIVILGVLGIVTTVGPMTLQFGDGTTPDLYGEFTLDSDVALNGPATGKLVLTEAGYLLSASTLASGIITVTGTGTGVVTGGQVVVGYF